MNQIIFKKEFDDIISIMQPDYNKPDYMTNSVERYEKNTGDLKYFFLSDTKKMAKKISSLLAELELYELIDTTEIAEKLEYIKHKIQSNLQLLMTKQNAVGSIMTNTDIDKNARFILEYIENEIERLKTTPKKNKKSKILLEELENPHDNIFKDGRGYLLFKEWNTHYLNNTKNHLANYSYLIKQMIKDGFALDVKVATFIPVLNKYNINITRLKTLPSCTTDEKKSRYLELKERIYNKKK